MFMLSWVLFYTIAKEIIKVFNQYSLKIKSRTTFKATEIFLSLVVVTLLLFFLSFFYSVIPLSTKTLADEKLYEIKNNKKIKNIDFSFETKEAQAYQNSRKKCLVKLTLRFKFG